MLLSCLTVFITLVVIRLVLGSKSCDLPHVHIVLDTIRHYLKSSCHHVTCSISVILNRISKRLLKENVGSVFGFADK